MDEELTLQLLRICALGFLFSICIETPILLVGLSDRHSIRRRLFSGIWLTACTYPIVSIVLWLLFQPTGSRTAYLWVAEIFAPVAECTLFWAAFGDRDHWNTRSMWRDFGAIVVANLASFLIGEWLDQELPWFKELFTVTMPAE